MDEFSRNELNVLLGRLDLKALLNDMEDKTLSTLDVLNKSCLVNLCKQKGLPTSGTKQILKDWMKKNGVTSLVSSFQSLQAKYKL